MVLETAEAGLTFTIQRAPRPPKPVDDAPPIAQCNSHVHTELSFHSGVRTPEEKPAFKQRFWAYWKQL